MSKESEWWTSPTESEDGRLIMVTGRRDISRFISNPRFHIRVEISWIYDDSPDGGMPSDDISAIMEQATDSLNEVLDKDPVAVMTGIYTGAGRRDWVFYTLSTNIFTKKLNQALSELPLLPLQIYAENDPRWAEYAEMKEISEIS
ncbi:MAG: DUF695 domain-containing protein [Muribaculaceae bacterium]|nr:DUF695 domain-containing protein [Muribaculaceae bacterium]